MPRMVVHNGVEMREDWPRRIEAAQHVSHYTVAGRQYPRIRFGDDNPDWGSRPCRDCGVIRGQFHVPDCEYETCPVCGQSFASGCGCDIDELRTSGEAAVDLNEMQRVARRNFRIFMALVAFFFLSLGALIIWSVFFDRPL